MRIVMHCMGMPFNGSTIKTESLGGSESAAYYVAREFAAEGHDVTLFTTSQDEGEWDGVKYVYLGNRTEQQPLGDRFHFYASSTPHDVCIIQRHPMAFRYQWASKINLWWLHDLALQRTAALVEAQMYNIDGVLCVSDYHIEQVTSIYNIDPAICHNIQNGVDLSLFETGPERWNQKPYKLLYTSRPERGSEALLKPGGIMEHLGEDYELTICAYKNVTEQMAPYYNYLYERAEALPNVVNFGHLDKGTLSDLMQISNLLVYPTTFEEVSCITAMEAMAAGLPMLTSEFAALPETCKDSGTTLLPIRGDYDNPDIRQGLFIDHIKKICENKTRWEALSRKQLKAAKSKTWHNVAERIGEAIDGIFSEQSPQAVAKQLLHNSDIYAYAFHHKPPKNVSELDKHALRAFDECYKFIDEPVWKEHYEKYYEYEKARGVNYGPENLTGNTRFEAVSALVNSLPAGAVVLDYGCAHGHYTINLAARFPDKHFIGVDIAQSNIVKAHDWATSDEVTNVEFVQGDYISGFELPAGAVDCIIAAEVLEHMADPWDCTDYLETLLADNGTMIITVPFGPWEAIGYHEHYPWRAHVHHFESDDIIDVWGDKEAFDSKVIPHGPAPVGGMLGSHLVSYRKGMPGVTCGLTGRIDYGRKLSNTIGKPTISLCMIVKNAEESLARCLNSAIEYVDEVIVNIDPGTTDTTRRILDDFADKYPMVRFSVEEGESAIEIGFAEARNATIERANGDWILWLDHDEVLHNPTNLLKYLKFNQFNGFAIPQHHMSVDPIGLLKTDLPVKIFRNGKGIKFFGFVHEHPELRLNAGVGRVWTTQDVSVVHDGYPDENIRRRRFQRNIGLMEKDRKENPDRVLGKMLWVRDLAQMIKFDIERGQQLSQQMVDRASEGVALWRQLVNDNLRMAVDSLDYYSALVNVLQPRKGVDYRFSIDAKDVGEGFDNEPKLYSGTFETVHDAMMLREAVEKEKLKHLGSRYR